MSKLREAAQAVIDMFDHKSWGTTSYIPASVEALRDALAEPDEVLAEDRLIAAAPELLAALRDLLSGWMYIREVHGDLYGVGWDRSQEKALAAIAKAEGRK